MEAMLRCLIAVWFSSIHAQIQSDIRVRLRPPGGNSGTVEVQFNATSPWGTICDDKWGIEDANVICTMLGFSSATAYHNMSAFGGGVGNILMDEVECLGNERRIDDCPRDPQWGRHNCATNHSEDAGVTCFQVSPTLPPEPTTIGGCTQRSDIRLEDGPNSAVGRVEVRLNGVWGTVCDDQFDYAEARIVCRALCFGVSHAKPFYPSERGTFDGSGTIHLDDLRCTGSESNLQSCPGNRTHDCTHKEDALVSCINYSEGAPLPPQPVVLCHDNNMEVAYNRSIYPTLQESDLSIRQKPAGCVVSKTINSTYIALFIGYKDCAYMDQTNDSHIIYSSEVKHDVTTSQVITRTHIFFIPVHCALPRIGDASRPFQPVTQTAPPQIGQGNFNIEMLIFADDNFQSPVASYPYNITLGAWLNVGVFLHTQDPQLKQVVPTCWATPDANSNSATQYPLITDKCPVDSTITLFPFNDTMFGFRIRSFDFLRNSSAPVYIHCRVFICRAEEKSTLECDQTCLANSNRKKRDELSAFMEVYHPETELARGPIIVSPRESNYEMPDPQPSDRVHNEMLDSASSGAPYYCYYLFNIYSILFTIVCSFVL